MKSTKQNWYELGIKHIWLPYTQMQEVPEQLKVIKTKGSYIYLEDGRKLIDGVSSWWATSHGHNHPYIAKQMRQQLKQFPHVMFAGLAHKPAYELASRLVEFVNKKEPTLNKVFFSDSGSTAVEVALKMAIQYHYNIGKVKHKFICFKNSYHGDTMGAMSLADPDNSMHAKFAKMLPKQIALEIPDTEEKFAKFVQTLDTHQANIAGLIIEPLVQCAGGMKFYNKDILNKILSECKKRNIITILDECATGFYRTGAKFAFHQTDFSADILILGKALTGGSITLSATMATDKIFNSFLSNSLDNALMHGPTFMANPLACSAGLASLDLFESNNYKELVQNITNIFHTELKNITSHQNVKDVRILGAIAVIELKQCNWQDICAMRKELINYNVWLRPFANVIYIMPPLTINKTDLKRLVNCAKKLVSIVKSH
ncbi:MAG: adenosylmethionine--8-amino-7-oxononanoate transaminase [Rickettsiales bacterium]|jgi:adenosylmethionine---8-amino-7-oxononanoate aminotransferase|nr:adenosylmethionine--8-amino-7-oxononanoate transaminase [Rickettsiales bacterium]